MVVHAQQEKRGITVATAEWLDWLPVFRKRGEAYSRMLMLP